MKKRLLCVLMAQILGAYAFAGCQKAPEASVDRDVYHAKSSVEREVENMKAKEDDDITAAEKEEAEPAGSCDVLAGTKENGIRICARIPEVPQTVSELTLRERDDLDAEKLKELLDSESGNVQDVTAEYLARREKELSEMSEDDKPGEWLHFGDDSLLILSDGAKEVSFERNTCASYTDIALKKNCAAIYKKAPERDVIKDGEDTGAVFSVARAQKILLKKLAVLGIKDIHLFEAFYYEYDGFAFYELQFTPCYENLAVASEFGGIKSGEVYPRGTAWIAEDGAAALSLDDYCANITGRAEKGKPLAFSQVRDVLEKYLEKDVLCGMPEAKLTQAELVYYPSLQEPELILTPAWHIYIPLKEMTKLQESGDAAWQKAIEKCAAWNIYLDAVTGKLLRVE